VAVAWLETKTMATNEADKANSQRAMAMSWAFSGNCEETVKYEQMVLGHYIATKDFQEQGEVAGEAADVCRENGQIDTAFQWYLTAHDLGLRQPQISAAMKNISEFRWASAQARVAARQGNQTEADKQVAAAKVIVESGLDAPEIVALHGLEGYVAFYRGDPEAALAHMENANPDDASIQYMMGASYEQLGQQAKASEHYARAAAATAHDPAVAFARPSATRKIVLTTKKG